MLRGLKTQRKIHLSFSRQPVADFVSPHEASLVRAVIGGLGDHSAPFLLRRAVGPAEAKGIEAWFQHGANLGDARAYNFDVHVEHSHFPAAGVSFEAGAARNAA